MRINRKGIYWVAGAALAGALVGVVVQASTGLPQRAGAKLLHMMGFKSEYEKSDHWVIGLLEGDDPTSLHTMADMPNPILIESDLMGVRAKFVADPFLVHKDGAYQLFFELFNHETGQGDIGLATSPNLHDWTFEGIVLDEPFHLSYPHVFEHEGVYYMVPETGEDLSVRLYRAEDYPRGWKYVATLMSGYRYADPTVVYYEGMWWMFVTTPENDHLNIYHAKALTGPWSPHAMNPVRAGDAHYSRPAGPVVVSNGSLYRFAQDDAPEYGRSVSMFEIVELSETTYRERPVGPVPLLKASGKGWNAAGMHHICPVRTKDGWVAVVDGRDY